MCPVGVYSQASDVSRSRGASLMARPGNSLVAAIRSQHNKNSQQLTAPCKHCHNILTISHDQPNAIHLILTNSFA